jgi:glycosyltransferase involved in cell wall biosynthesis
MGTWLFIPIYNEQRSMHIVRHNIRVFNRYFPNSTILISDNQSTDGTWEALREMANSLPQNIILIRNDENVGFARNLINVRLIPELEFVVMIGGSDLFCKKGLCHLALARKNNPNVELFMSNWAYITNDPKPKVISKLDVDHAFSANTLEEFFGGAPYVPVGIMQYAGIAKHFHRFQNYTQYNSPQISAFIDAFPCTFIALGNPPISYVRLIEGWRKSNELILQVHREVVTQVLEAVTSAKTRGKLLGSVADQVNRKYLRNFLFLTLELTLINNWAGFKSTGRLRAFFSNAIITYKLYAVFQKAPVFSVAVDVFLSCILLSKRMFIPFKKVRILNSLYELYKKKQFNGCYRRSKLAGSNSTTKGRQS